MSRLTCNLQGCTAGGLCDAWKMRRDERRAQRVGLQPSARQTVCYERSEVGQGGSLAGCEVHQRGRKSGRGHESRHSRALPAVDSVPTAANFISGGIFLAAIAPRSLLLAGAPIGCRVFSFRGPACLSVQPSPASHPTPFFPATRAPATAHLCAFSACQFIATSVRLPRGTNAPASIACATPIVARFTSKAPRVGLFPTAPTPSTCALPQSRTPRP